MIEVVEEEEEKEEEEEEDNDADDKESFLSDPGIVVLSSIATIYPVGTTKWLKELDKCKL